MEEIPIDISGINLLKVVAEGGLKETEYLLKLGAPTNAVDKCGSNLLHLAVLNNNLLILDMLLENDLTALESPNTRGLTPLLLAINQNNFEATKRLIDAGANINARSYEGDTPIHAALQTRSKRLFDLLMTRSDVLVDVKNENQDTPLFLACHQGNYYAAKKLVEAGACVDNTNSMKQTALHAAVHYPRITHFLIRKGVDINAMCTEWNTPLHIAVRFGSLETAAMLLYYDCDVNIENDLGWTPFIYALYNQHVEMQDILYGYYTEAIKEPLIQDITIDSACRTKSPFAGELLLTNLNFCASNLLSYIMPNVAENDDMFKASWDALKWDRNNPLVEDFLMMEWLFYQRDDKTKVEKNVFTLIESPNTDLLIKCFTFKKDPLRYPQNRNTPASTTLLTFLTNMHTLKCSLDLQTKLIFRLMELSVPLTAHDIYRIYYFYGCSDLLKLLRYIKYEGMWPWKDDPLCCLLRLIFDVKNNVAKIKRELLRNFKSEFVDLEEYRKGLEYYLGYCADRQVVQKCDLNLPDEVLPSVPKLAELARDRIRDHLIKTNKVTYCSQYHTIVDHMPVPNICKKLLQYECKLYQVKL